MTDCFNIGRTFLLGWWVGIEASRSAEDAFNLNRED